MSQPFEPAYTLVPPRKSFAQFLCALWKNLRRRVVLEVPEDDALCEFDCRKPQCSLEEWQNCERRLRSLPPRS